MARLQKHGLLATVLQFSRIGAQEVITDDRIFYGQSPLVDPPKATGLGDWSDAYTQAQALVGQMTLEEKVNLTGGISSDTSCSGSIPAIPRLGFPGLCLSDAGNGLRSTDSTSGWASGISVGSSWNRNLTRARAVGMANEFRANGINIALGPVVGPVGRIASGGRNWEGFSVDPYLSGALAYETVKSIQSVGVVTSTKHFIGNEQETNRNPTGDVFAVSANIDDKTMHELYLWPFQDAVYAGTGNIMCSYNRVNNSYGCANSKTQNGLLKTELGFQGFVVSDWFAQHAGVATAIAGLDMVMPSETPFWGANLKNAVTNGSVPEWRLDDMATRIIATWYQFGQDKIFHDPGIGMPDDLTTPHPQIDYFNTTYRQVILEGAIEGHVLVKNDNKALPLKSPRIVSLFGYSAKAQDAYNIRGTGWNTGSGAYKGASLSTANETNPILQIASSGTLYTAGGSGATQPAYVSSPFEALSQRAYEDEFHLFWDFTSFKPVVDRNSDACIVIGNAFASEDFDRPGLHDDYTDGLIKNVASNCSNTIAVFHNAGVRLVDQFLDHPNVTAIVFAHLPGQDNGRALTKLLFGDVNFSGKLTYTVPKNETDYAGLQSPTEPRGIYELFPQSDFSEGVYIDYRAFDAKRITPRYEFGFGLSYTTFEYSNLAVTKTSDTILAGYPIGPILPGGHQDLWDDIARVSATVANTGGVDGAEAAQLYVGIPGAPARQLRGFDKPSIKAGESVKVDFKLTRRDLSTWDVVAQKWLLQTGEYKIYVGSSSRNLPLESTLTL